MYNVQPGVILNYSTGASKAENSDDNANPDDNVTTDCDYVLNKSNHKIHTPDCHNVNAMKEENENPFSTF